MRVFAPRRSPSSRERALRAVKARYAEGRIGTRELEARVERILRSSTPRDVNESLRELSLRGPRRLVHRRVRRFQRAILRMHALVYVAANASLLAIWAMLGEGVFWPAVFLVPSTVLLAGHAAISRKLTRALARLGLSS
jgi:hypothetical protein